MRYGPRERSGGLTQQGWRDVEGPASEDADGGGIVRPDGSTPRAPLADTDVQAVAYAALRALAVLSGEEAWTRRAEALAGRLETDFGPGVMALEGDDLAVPGPGSQLGWLLWSGALGPAQREAVAERLCEPDILTAWGLRTLSSSYPAFDPQSYHRGSVWPFDSWLGWSGLRAAGREEDAERVRSGVLAALDRLGHAPELYAVTHDGRARAVALDEPRPGVDRGGAMGARERLGRATGLAIGRGLRAARRPARAISSSDSSAAVCGSSIAAWCTASRRPLTAASTVSPWTLTFVCISAAR